MVWRFGGWGVAMEKNRGRGGVPDRRGLRRGRGSASVILIEIYR